MKNPSPSTQASKVLPVANAFPCDMSLSILESFAPRPICLALVPPLLAVGCVAIELF